MIGCTCTHWRSTSVISTAGSLSASSLAASKFSGETCIVTKSSIQLKIDWNLSQNGLLARSISYHQFPTSFVLRLGAVRHEWALFHCGNNVLNTLGHTVPNLENDLVNILTEQGQSPCQRQPPGYQAFHTADLSQWTPWSGQPCIWGEDGWFTAEGRRTWLFCRVPSCHGSHTPPRVCLQKPPGKAIQPGWK